jgi:CheY-like chemotaxis protein
MSLPKILIVEDEKSLALKFSRVLEDLGECAIVKCTSDVFYHLNLNPQVILLDICLVGDPTYRSEEAGIRILEKIRELPDPGRKIPVIVITGCSDPGLKKRCRELGVKNYFIKSQVSNKRLHKAVEKALEWRQQEQQKVKPYSEHSTSFLVEPMIEASAKIFANKDKMSVFLCHAHKDKEKVCQYYNRLKNERGIDPWLDAEKLLPGTDWELEIGSAVRSSDVVLVFLSKYSVNKEGYVQKEIKQALDAVDEKPDGTIYIIPLRLEDCEVPKRLQRWQWLDLYETDSYEKMLTSLRKRANNLAAKSIGIQ